MAVLQSKYGRIFEVSNPAQAEDIEVVGSAAKTRIEKVWQMSFPKPIGFIPVAKVVELF